MCPRMRTPTVSTRLLPVAAALCTCFAQNPVGARPQDPAGDPLKTCDLNLDSQPLDRALAELIRQCDVQLLYPSEIAKGVSAPALKGQYALDTVLHRLLSGTGLTYIRYGADSIEIVRAAAKDSHGPESTSGTTEGVPREFTDRKTPEVVITTTAEGLVATRAETPLSEIPQTISIVTAEQMLQQNNASLADALSDAVGITTVQIDSLNQSYYSRGFLVDTYHLDGGAALHEYPYESYPGTEALLSVPDMGEIDHIEVLRGADALFGTDGNPGATVNLVRKRPLDTFEIDTHSVAGSWNNYRQEMDITGPLGLDGALRGRLDAAYSSRDYFYQGAYSEHKNIFGVVEYDLTSRTLLTLGGSYQWNLGRPFEGGLPMLPDGNDARLPRGTAFTFDWERFYTQNREAYLQLHQDLGSGWKLKVDATALNGSVDYTLAEFQTAVAQGSGMLLLGPMGLYTVTPTLQKELSFDVTISGSADWLGHREQIAVGADYTHFHEDMLLDGLTPPYGPPNADAYDFNSALYPNPRSVAIAQYVVTGSSSATVQVGAWASALVQITAPWSVTSGLRISDESGSSTLIAQVPILSITTYIPEPRYAYVDKATPYVGTMLSLTSHYWLYASYADIYDSNSGEVSVSNRLSPADGVNIEAGIKGSWRDGALTGALALYSIVQRGLSSLAANNQSLVNEQYQIYCCFYPDGRNESKGVDLEVIGSIQPDWLIAAGYTFNNNRGLVPDALYTFNNNKALVPNASYGVPNSTQTPRHLLKIWTSRQLSGRLRSWSVGASLQAQSSNYAVGLWCATPAADGGCPVNYQPFHETQPSYAVVSPRIGYQIDAQWRVAVSVNNLFDKTYYQTISAPDGGNWYGDPRNFTVRVDGKF
jgi:outer-membrane receptor for ferric coprogen and ferric-rhodotorulic acid